MFVWLQCEWLPSKKFEKGSYKCNCKQGYEYPFNDNAWYFDGQTMEEEWRKKEEGDPNSRCLSLGLKRFRKPGYVSSKRFRGTEN